MGMHLLRPSPQFNEIFVGALAKAQQLAAVRVHAVSCLSNHYHLLLSVDDAQQLAKFMQHFASNLATEVARLHGWRGRLWAGRYKSVLVSNEEPAQVGRLRYLLSQGCKEGLVSKPADWPGVHSAAALESGQPLSGIWIDRSREYEARRRKRTPVDPAAFTTRLQVNLEPLPCWRDLSADQVRARIAMLVRDIEADTATMHRFAGTAPAGPEAMLRQRADFVPDHVKRTPAPLVHTVSEEVRRRVREALRLFTAAYREASVRLRSGDRTAEFPEGSFPPALPFVVFGEEVVSWAPG